MDYADPSTDSSSVFSKCIGSGGLTVRILVRDLSGKHSYVEKVLKHMLNCLPGPWSHVRVTGTEHVYPTLS